MKTRHVVTIYRFLLATLITVLLLTHAPEYAMVVVTWLWIFERPIESKIINLLKLKQKKRGKVK